MRHAIIIGLSNQSQPRDATSVARVECARLTLRGVIFDGA